MILEVEIERIEYPEIERSMRITEDGKGIRLDVYVADGEHTVYNVEMQAANTYELPERTRYYQGIIDMDIISKGESYRILKKSYIVFICTFDLFEEGLYKYTFENRCKENPEILLGDGTQKIFLNAKGLLDDAGEDMKAFLRYILGEETDNDFVRQLKDRAIAVKQNIEWRKDYMMQHIREQLKLEEGIEQGIEQGLVMLIRKKLLKSKTLETIAVELEYEVDEIRDLYEAIEHCGVSCEIDEIMQYLNAKSEEVPLK